MSLRRHAEPTQDAHRWLGRFQHIVASAEEAIGRIRPGQRVFVGSACGQPRVLLDALVDHASELDDLEIVHLMTLGEPAGLHAKLAECYRLRPFFVEEGVGEEVWGHAGDYTPILLSDIPES